MRTEDVQLADFSSYYDNDADLALLNSKTIVFLGYVPVVAGCLLHTDRRRRRFGNQGAAQAQNLRDSGIPNEAIIVANRPDSYAEDAKSKGFNVEHDFVKAAKVADGRCPSKTQYSPTDYLDSGVLAHSGPGPATGVQRAVRPEPAGQRDHRNRQRLQRLLQAPELQA